MPCYEFIIEPDDAIGFDDVTLIAESQQSIALRGFLARILGWAEACSGAVDKAARSIRLSSSFRATLVLSVDFDVVPLAQALHRRTMGADRPFIVCDQRRREAVEASARSPASREQAMAAFDAAREGSFCVRSRRLPHDFASIVILAGNPSTRVQLVICADEQHAHDPLLAAAAPIQVPPLRDRKGELERIIDEYTSDAIIELGLGDLRVTSDERRWIIENAAASLPEIEKATIRLAALKTSPNASQAAARLGMAPVSLLRWMQRRRWPMRMV
jgi:hypothetical protein